MNKILFVIITSLCILSSYAKEVNGYYRKDGTYVRPYTRKDTTAKRVEKTTSESRTFSKAMRLRKFNEQRGICAHCGKKCAFSEMEGDHIIPWSKGGKTVYSNLQMLCRYCNRSKGNRYSY